MPLVWLWLLLCVVRCVALSAEAERAFNCSNVLTVPADEGQVGIRPPNGCMCLVNRVNTSNDGADDLYLIRNNGMLERYAIAASEPELETRVTRYYLGPDTARSLACGSNVVVVTVGDALLLFVPHWNELINLTPEGLSYYLANTAGLSTYGLHFSDVLVCASCWPIVVVGLTYDNPHVVALRVGTPEGRYERLDVWWAQPDAGGNARLDPFQSALDASGTQLVVATTCSGLSAGCLYSEGDTRIARFTRTPGTNTWTAHYDTALRWSVFQAYGGARFAAGRTHWAYLTRTHPSWQSTEFVSRLVVATYDSPPVVVREHTLTAYNSDALNFPVAVNRLGNAFYWCDGNVWFSFLTDSLLLQQERTLVTARRQLRSFSIVPFQSAYYTFSALLPGQALVDWDPNLRDPTYYMFVSMAAPRLCPRPSPRWRPPPHPPPHRHRRPATCRSSRRPVRCPTPTARACSLRKPPRCGATRPPAPAPRSTSTSRAPPAPPTTTGASVGASCATAPPANSAPAAAAPNATAARAVCTPATSSIPKPAPTPCSTAAATTQTRSSSSAPAAKSTAARAWSTARPTAPRTHPPTASATPSPRPTATS